MTMTAQELQALLIEAVYDSGYGVLKVESKQTLERRGLDVTFLDGTRLAVSIKDTTGTVEQQKARRKGK